MDNDLWTLAFKMMALAAIGAALLILGIGVLIGVAL